MFSLDFIRNVSLTTSKKLPAEYPDFEVWAKVLKELNDSNSNLLPPHMIMKLLLFVLTNRSSYFAVNRLA